MASVIEPMMMGGSTPWILYIVGAIAKGADVGAAIGTSATFGSMEDRAKNRADI